MVIYDSEIKQSENAPASPPAVSTPFGKSPGMISVMVKHATCMS